MKDIILGIICIFIVYVLRKNIQDFLFRDKSKTMVRTERNLSYKLPQDTRQSQGQDYE